MVMTVIAVNLALLIVEKILPYTSRLLNTSLSVHYNDGQFILDMVILTVITGLLAGSYPAFVLSSFRPASILKIKLLSGSKGGRLRKVLVVVQYTFSILFIICTLVMTKQYNHMLQADPGFNRENVMYFRLREHPCKTYALIKQELEKNPAVLSVTTASEIPVQVMRGDIEWGDRDRKKNIIARIMWCGYDLPTTLGIQMKEGRFYSPEYASDSTGSIVVNDEVVKIMGWKDPIGQQFLLFDKTYSVIGVISDISFFPFNIGGSALILPFGASNDYVFAKLHSGWSNNTLSSLRAVFEKYVPAYPFEYGFLKDISSIC
jgi:hypothetical protein